MKTYAYGFPRLGKNREYKKSLEDFWQGNISEKGLKEAVSGIDQQRQNFYKQFVDIFPSGEMTLYDNILDTAVMFGVCPFENLQEYFEYARGRNALEMMKFFGTNYHYLVPVIPKGFKFNLAYNKLLEYKKNLSGNNPAYFIGPFTFLKLSRVKGGFNSLLDSLCRQYKNAFGRLKKQGVKFFHIDEPAFVLDLTKSEINLITKVYKKYFLPFKQNIYLFTYYESVSWLKDLFSLPSAAIGLDFVSDSQNLKTLQKTGFPKDKILVAGIINGRIPDRADILERVDFLKRLESVKGLSRENIYISNAMPLFHIPVTLDNEKSLTPAKKKYLSFAAEKLYELSLLKDVLSGRRAKEAGKWAGTAKKQRQSLSSDNKTFNTLSLREDYFTKRRKLQDKFLGLPLFPSTTIGSFPQDKELRQMRLKFRKNKIPAAVYNKFIEKKISSLIELQEKMGLDVFVHGEFERSDMVEFFAQKLGGIITTDRGWVISYGSRVYRPPIIIGPIKRKKPLTLKEILYAQSLTSRPVKGIFTGPVTILAWSYNLRRNEDSKVAFELAGALNQEARDLVKKGIKIIQIDEPAIKERMPLKEKKRKSYFSWAVRAFNLTAKLPDKIQVHTHMCYSEFSDIIFWIMKMNFDVITIEASRSRGGITAAFKKVKFSRQIGPGVWDIHSKYPAEEEVMREIMKKSVRIFGKDKVWVNPDCGLKTRGWEEVIISLRKIVDLAKTLRTRYGR